MLVATNYVQKMCNMFIVLNRELLLVSMYVCVYIYYVLYDIGNMYYQLQLVSKHFASMLSVLSNDV